MIRQSGKSWLEANSLSKSREEEGDMVYVNPVHRRHIATVRVLIVQGRLATAYQYASDHRGQNADALAGYPDDVAIALQTFIPTSYQRPPDVLLVPYRRAMESGDLEVARQVVERLAETFFVLPEFQRIEEAEAMRCGTTGGNTHPDLDEPSPEELAALEAALEVDFE